MSPIWRLYSHAIWAHLVHVTHNLKLDWTGLDLTCFFSLH